MEVSQLEQFVESCKLTPIDLIHAISGLTEYALSLIH